MPAVVVGKDSGVPVASPWDTLLLNAFHMGEGGRRMSAFHSCKILLVMWLMVSYAVRGVDAR